MHSSKLLIVSPSLASTASRSAGHYLTASQPPFKGCWEAVNDCLPEAVGGSGRQSKMVKTPLNSCKNRVKNSFGRQWEAVVMTTKLSICSFLSCAGLLFRSLPRSPACRKVSVLGLAGDTSQHRLICSNSFPQTRIARF